MKKLPLVGKIAYVGWLIVLSILVFTSINQIRAQEGVEIPGPELEEASFTPVRDLEIGDWVFVKREEGLVAEEISKLEYKQESVEVYNLSVGGEETFFANDFAVHNKAGEHASVCDMALTQRLSTAPTETWTVGNHGQAFKNMFQFRKCNMGGGCPSCDYFGEGGGGNLCLFGVPNKCEIFCCTGSGNCKFKRCGGGVCDGQQCGNYCANCQSCGFDRDPNDEEWCSDAAFRNAVSTDCGEQSCGHLLGSFPAGQDIDRIGADAPSDGIRFRTDGWCDEGCATAVKITAPSGYVIKSISFDVQSYMQSWSATDNSRLEISRGMTPDNWCSDPFETKAVMWSHTQSGSWSSGSISIGAEYAFLYLYSKGVYGSREIVDNYAELRNIRVVLVPITLSGRNLTIYNSSQLYYSACGGTNVCRWVTCEGGWIQFSVDQINWSPQQTWNSSGDWTYDWSIPASATGNTPVWARVQCNASSSSTNCLLGMVALATPTPTPTNTPTPRPTNTPTPRPTATPTPACPLAPGDAPSNVTATRAGSNINIQWRDNANGENRFRITVSVDGGSYSFLTFTGSLSGTGSIGSYTHTGVSASSTYRYRIRAENYDYGSDCYTNWGYSNVVPTPTPTPTGMPTSTPIPTSTPGPTSTPTPTPTPCPSCGWVDCSTDVLRVDGNYNKFIQFQNVANEDGYRLYRCQGAGCNPNVLVTNLGVGSTSFTDTNGGVGFIPGITLVYEVRPFKAGCPALNCADCQNVVPAAPTGTPTPSPTPTPAATCEITSLSPGAHNDVPIGTPKSVAVNVIVYENGSPVGNPEDYIDRIDFTSQSIAPPPPVEVVCLSTQSPCNQTATNEFPVPDTYSVTVIANDIGSAVIHARVTLNNGEWCEDPITNGTTITVVAPGPWFQTIGGDVHAQGTITSSVPSGNYFSLDLNDYPGVVSYSSATPDFGSGDVSSKGWLAKDSLLLGYSYEDFKEKLISSAESWNGNANDLLSRLPAAGETKILYASSATSAHLPAMTFNTGGKLIILTDTTAHVNAGNVEVAPGSFLAVFAGENINIDSIVSQVEGIYLAPDGSISTDTGSNQLFLEGIFYANRFSLQRDLGAGNLNPAVVFTSRPDFLIEFPNELKTSYFFEQEVAP